MERRRNPDRLEQRHNKPYIQKERERKVIKNYRGITLIGTVYKIYASILNKKLEKKVTDKLKEGQFGFRKERNNECGIYVELCN